MRLRLYLIPKGHYTKNNYGLKNSLNSKGTKNEDEGKKDSSTQVRGGGGRGRK